MMGLKLLDLKFCGGCGFASELFKCVLWGPLKKN